MNVEAGIVFIAADIKVPTNLDSSMAILLVDLSIARRQVWKINVSMD
jgi:hypothetical protein